MNDLKWHKSGYPTYQYPRFLSRQILCAFVLHLFVCRRKKRRLDLPLFECNDVKCMYLCVWAFVVNYFLLFMPSSRKPLAKGLELIFRAVI